MVCRVNGETASSSEILAACLQDHQRAVIMGERSRGKASVQNTFDFEDGELTVTSALFFRPSGRKLDRIGLPDRPIDEWGVRPDDGFALPTSWRERDRLAEVLEVHEGIVRRDRPVREPHPGFHDRQLEMALAYLRKQAQK
jgi:carboxyl-terminal processing protease